MSGQESEKGNSNLIPLKTLVMHMLDKGESMRLPSSAAQGLQ